MTSPSAAPHSCLIRAERVTKRYRSGTVALREVDLSVEPGEIFGLVGPNGAGKTTLHNILATRFPATSGTVWIAGIDALADPPAARRHLGYVSQGNTLDRHLSTREVLEFHARYFGASRAGARHAAGLGLERADLAPFADVPAAHLSGGIAQRVMIARATLHRPSVLLLDEPTIGLDTTSRQEVWRQLSDLRADGVAIVLTSHYLDEAERLCDRVGILVGGRMCTIGRPLELVARLGSVVEIEAACALSTIDGAFRGESSPVGVDRVVAPASNLTRIRVRIDERSENDVINAVLDRLPRPVDYRVRRPTLEMAFDDVVVEGAG
jgi:ABC-2 type transport system ATP-binding protein